MDRWSVVSYSCCYRLFLHFAHINVSPHVHGGNVHTWGELSVGLKVLTPLYYLCSCISVAAMHRIRTELTSLRDVQSASWQSASWRIRELSSYH